MEFSDTFLKYLKVLAVSLCAGLALPAAALAQTAPTAATPQSAAQPSAEALTAQQKEAFRTKMLSNPPSTGGCFEAQPSDPNWKPVQCLPAPKFPNPLALGIRSKTAVGKGNDYFAEVTGTIASATGSFDSATGITAIYSPIGQDKTNTVYPNTYTFQLNANTFPTKATTACANATTCLAWEQFLFSQRSGCDGTPCVYIEYWLFDNPSCPQDGRSGNGCTCPSPEGDPWWSWYDKTGATASGCYFNTEATGNAEFAAPAIADLGKLKFTAQANAKGLDVVTLQTADGKLHANTFAASTLNLAQGWTGAEFNIFGDCCAYPVFLNAGSSLTVRLSTTSASAPVCSISFTGSTAETNNLSLVANSCAPAAPSDIVFTESGGGDPTGYTIADPHLATQTSP